MQVTTVDIVTLPDATTWLRHGDRMVRFEIPVGLMDAPEPKAPRVVHQLTTAKASAMTIAAAVEEEPRRRPRNASDPAAVARARERFESSNDKLAVIAKEVDVNYNTLFYIARREGWTRKALVKS